MSRIANAPVTVPKGVETTLTDSQISVKGNKGNLNLPLHSLVAVMQDGEELKVLAKDDSREASAIAGTFRSLINNMVVGVTEGFQKKLELQGVGYRAKAQGNKINLTVGFSHPIGYELAAEIREFRPPEPYKGKGIRYVDEHVYRKEAKKK